MTDTTPPPAPIDSWEAILDALRRRYPGQRDSVLFCIHKLQQNPDLTLRDFRPEAELYRIPVAGRALHSARALLGLSPKSATPEPVAAPTVDAGRSAARRQKRTLRATHEDTSIEDRVVAAVRQLQDAAGEQTSRLRDAIRQAIAILQRAIDG